MEWRVKAIRGATTASENTEEAIASAVIELLQELHKRNCIDPDRIVSVIFTATKDLDAVFPAAIARQVYPEWQNVALMDMQQMHVEGSLRRCIRLLIHVNLPADADVVIYHPYLRDAENLRTDFGISNLRRETTVEWQVKAIRGATTASENTEEAIDSAVTELLKDLHNGNCIDPDRIVSVMFTATQDLDAVYPAAKARRAYPEWQHVALMDVQQMHVKDSLPRCIRFLMHANLPADVVIHHPYLRGARDLHPDDFGTSNLGRETIKAIRGATTASENTKEAIDSAVTELLQELECRNRIDPDRIISVIFTATQDLDTVFPATIARRAYSQWRHVALMDMQQMHVEGSLPRCIRFLIHANLPADVIIYHPYLRGASNLRPDRSLVS